VRLQAVHHPTARLADKNCEQTLYRPLTTTGTLHTIIESYIEAADGLVLTPDCLLSPLVRHFGEAHLEL
jgi:hypothetical protein